jgi:hypothetical protein
VGPPQARGRGGRLALDEPTTLPEGAAVDVIVIEDAIDAMPEDEREALLASIDRGLVDVDGGRTVSAAEALRRIRTG